VVNSSGKSCNKQVGLLYVMEGQKASLLCYQDVEIVRLLDGNPDFASMVEGMSFPAIVDSYPMSESMNDKMLVGLSYLK
jgi:hypothetical protein